MLKFQSNMAKLNNEVSEFTNNTSSEFTRKLTTKLNSSNDLTWLLTLSVEEAELVSNEYVNLEKGLRELKSQYLNELHKETANFTSELVKFYKENFKSNPVVKTNRQGNATYVKPLKALLNEADSMSLRYYNEVIHLTTPHFLNLARLTSNGYVVLAGNTVKLSSFSFNTTAQTFAMFVFSLKYSCKRWNKQNEANQVAFEYCEEHNLNVNNYFNSAWEVANKHAAEQFTNKWFSENHGTFVGFSGNDNCEECMGWYVMEGSYSHRCECGNRRVYAYAEGDLLSGFYMNVEAY